MKVSPCRAILRVHKRVSPDDGDPLVSLNRTYGDR